MKKFLKIDPQLQLLLGYIGAVMEATKVVHDAAVQHPACWTETIERSSRMRLYYNEFASIIWASAAETKRTKMRRLEFALRNARNLQEIEKTIESLEGEMARADEYIFCAVDFLRRRLVGVLSRPQDFEPDVSCHDDNRLRSVVPMMWESAGEIQSLLDKLLPFVAEDEAAPERTSVGVMYQHAIGSKEQLLLHIAEQRRKYSRQEPRTDREIAEFGEVVVDSGVAVSRARAGYVAN